MSKKAYNYKGLSKPPNKHGYRYITGQPRLFNSPEDIQPLIEDYFKQCDTNKRPYTVAGLAHHIGFSSRQSLFDYEKFPEFADTLKRAKFRIEAQRNEQLIAGQGNVVGMIFDLKNNFDWKDSKELQVSGQIEHKMDPDQIEERIQYLLEQRGSLLEHMPEAEFETLSTET